MRVCGIVAEYNPFHSGHGWHISETRRLLGADTAIVCCLSGNWVQRGEAALLPKHLRARAALLNGADLVVELPAAHALRSAEGFAQSTLAILSGLGVVSHLSFGAETDNLDELLEIAQVLLEHRTVQETLTQLKTGISYAAARERALYTVIRDRAALIRSPNNILAVEYLKALLVSGSGIRPVAIARKGAAHDSPEAGEGYASASFIRAALRAGGDVSHYMPPTSGRLLNEAAASGRALLDTSRLEAAWLSQLRRQTPVSLATLPDMAEGLEHRLHGAIRQGGDLAGILAAAKTRRYPEARIRRALACAYLGITASDAAQPPLYARVLGVGPRGRQALALARKQATLPVLTKPAHVKALAGDAVSAFSREALATDLYSLALPAWQDIRPGDDWRAGAVIENGGNSDEKTAQQPDFP